MAKEETVEKQQQQQQEEEEEENPICGICLDDVIDVLDRGQLQRCSHLFHYECILKWAEVTNLCPACKQEFSFVTKCNQDGRTIEIRYVERVVQVHEEGQEHGQDLISMYANMRCTVCGSGERRSQLVSCRGDCNTACHADCIGLNHTSESEWYCHLCAHESEANSSTRRRIRRRQAIPRSVPIHQIDRERQRRRRELEQRVGFVRNARRRTHISEYVPTPHEHREYVHAVQRELQDLERRAATMPSNRNSNSNTQQSQCLGSRRSGGGGGGGSSSSSSSSSTRTGEQKACTKDPSKPRSEVDRMWKDFQDAKLRVVASHTRRMPSASASASSASVSSASRHQAQAMNSPSTTCVGHPALIASSKELFQRMREADEADQASTRVNAPQLAKLSMTSEVRQFFSSKSRLEKQALLNAGCLDNLTSWLESQPSQQQHPRVTQVVLSILSALPIARDHLRHCKKLSQVVLLCCMSGKDSPENIRAATQLIEAWSTFGTTRTAHVLQRISSAAAAAAAVVIEAQVPAAPKVPAIVPMRASSASSTALTAPPPSQDSFAKHAVCEYVKKCLMKHYEKGAMSRDEFKKIAQFSTRQILSTEWASSVVEQQPQQLRETCKRRIQKLVDRMASTKSSFSTYSAAPKQCT